MSGPAGAGQSPGGWVRQRLLPVLMFLAVIAITVGLFVYRDSVTRVQGLGYLGAFVISFAGNATVILPMPGLVLIFALGASLNPVLVGLVAGVGGSVGEITGYTAGYSGRAIVSGHRTYEDAAGWLRRWGFWVVLLFTVTPLPVDVIGVAAGALRYPLWKFLAACLLGKSVLYTGMAVLGALGWEAVVGLPWDSRTMWACAWAVLAVVVLLGGALFLESWSWRRGGRSGTGGADGQHQD